MCIQHVNIYIYIYIICVSNKRLYLVCIYMYIYMCVCMYLIYKCINIFETSRTTAVSLCYTYGLSRTLFHSSLSFLKNDQASPKLGPTQILLRSPYLRPAELEAALGAWTPSNTLLWKRVGCTKKKMIHENSICSMDGTCTNIWLGRLSKCAWNTTDDGWCLSNRYVTSLQHNISCSDFIVIELYVCNIVARIYI